MKEEIKQVLRRLEMNAWTIAVNMFRARRLMLPNQNSSSLDVHVYDMVATLALNLEEVSARLDVLVSNPLDKSTQKLIIKLMGGSLNLAQGLQQVAKNQSLTRELDKLVPKIEFLCEEIKFVLTLVKKQNDKEASKKSK